jgi:hypothetical protein
LIFSLRGHPVEHTERDSERAGPGFRVVKYISRCGNAGEMEFVVVAVVAASEDDSCFPPREAGSVD